MKKILLLSDTHSCMDPWIIKHVRQADEVWHAGDIGSGEVVDKIEKITVLRAVTGNIDGQELRMRFPGMQYFECEGAKVYMTHIGGYPGRYRPHVKKFIASHRVDIFISGHSHILKVMYDESHGLLHMNPGAAGKYSFHKRRTMLRFSLHQSQIKDLEIIEMTK